MEDSPVRTSITSALFRESSFAILGLSLASWWDFFIDHNSLAFTWTTKQYQDDKKAGIQVLVPYEKFVFLCGVTVVPMVVLLPADHPRLVLIFTAALNSQIILFGGFIGALCIRCYGKYFPNNITTLVIVTFCVMTLVSVYLVNHDPSLGITLPEAQLLDAQWVCSILYLIAVVRWFYGEFCLNLAFPRLRYYRTVLINKMKPTGSHDGQDQGKKEDEIDWKKIHSDNTAYYPIMYALIALLCVACLAGVYSAAPSVFFMTDRDLLLLNVPVLVYKVCMIVLSSQVNKHAIVAYLYALLESKKSYVRYISHELRTPLNTAVLGLEMMLREADGRPTGNAEDAERLETLSDINTSCMTAVDIQNDLLSFEKMESGILELHQEKVAGLPFVRESMAMFTVHARSKGVTIVTDFCPTDVGSGSGSGSGSRPLNNLDMIHLDKFKVSQVIRNLVSNALKFTPRGGTVTVKAYFEQTPESVVADGEVHTPATCLPDLGVPATVPGLWSLWRAQARRPRTPPPTISPLRVRAASLRIFADGPTVRSSRPMLVRSQKSSTNIEAGGGAGSRGTSEEVDGGILKGHLVVSVRDTGAGISFENQQKLFKDIVQFNPEKLQAGGGSGLGLWITKGIMDLHEGSIEVHSEGEGHGCTFTVKLPMRVKSLVGGMGVTGGSRVDLETEVYGRDMEAKAGQSGNSVREFLWVPEEEDAIGSSSTSPPSSHHRTPSPRPVPHPEPTATLQPPPHTALRPTPHQPPSPTASRALRLLVVDDSHLNRKMILRVMRSHGHVCEEADDGIPAVDLIKRLMQEPALSNDSSSTSPTPTPTYTPFDMILMDFMMPNLDGPGATKAIRALGYTGKIYGLTGNVLQHDIAHFMACGADGVLHKPLDMGHFHLLMNVTTAPTAPATT